MYGADSVWAAVPNKDPPHIHTHQKLVYFKVEANCSSKRLSTLPQIKQLEGRKLLTQTHFYPTLPPLRSVGSLLPCFCAFYQG